MQNKLAPICLFVYNRLDNLKQTVESLQKNDSAKDSDLFIFSDGPKDEIAKPQVIAVRKYLKSISGFKNITIIERQENYGLAKSIIAGVSEIINKYGKIIVLEDDMVSSPYFLRYLNEALDFYENEDRVVSIHAYIYPVKTELPETFFIKGADCWGWATWKRGWDLFQSDGKKLLTELKNKNLTKQFDFNGSFDYSKMLEGQIFGKNNSWAIRWYASAFLANKLTLYPGKTLIINTGLTDGTHCKTADDFLNTQISDKPISIKKIQLKENKQARKAFIKFFNTLKPSIFRRLINKIKRICYQ